MKVAHLKGKVSQDYGGLQMLIIDSAPPRICRHYIFYNNFSYRILILKMSRAARNFIGTKL